MKAVMPALPKPDANGHFPAIEYTRASLARSLIRERTALGLTQEQLAKLAGVREETLSRLESGKHSPTVRTVEKIERALQKAKRLETAEDAADVRTAKRASAELRRTGQKGIPLAVIKKRLGMK